MNIQTHGEVRTILRPMSLADIDQVETIDRLSFQTPWPRDAFLYEINRNPNTLCWVAELVPPGEAPIIVATAVIWLIVDEAHLGTLAVRPGFRQQGLARQLLATALLSAAHLGATHALLEVRSSNQAAQNLYLKFGFEVVGTRKGYYQDTQEDAVLMTLAALDTEKLAVLADGG